MTDNPKRKNSLGHGWVPPDEKRCPVVDPVKGRCVGWVMRGKPFCFFHNPDRTAVQEAAKLGRERQKEMMHPEELLELAERLTTPAEVLTYLSGLVGAGRKGRMSPGMIQALTATCKAIMEGMKIAAAVEPGVMHKTETEMMLEAIDILEKTNQTAVLQAMRDRLQIGLEGSR